MLPKWYTGTRPPSMPSSTATLTKPLRLFSITFSAFLLTMNICWDKSQCCSHLGSGVLNKLLLAEGQHKHMTNRTHRVHPPASLTGICWQHV